MKAKAARERPLSDKAGEASRIWEVVCYRPSRLNLNYLFTAKMRDLSSLAI